MMRIRRRQLLKAVGLGALSSLVSGTGNLSARAGETSYPSRIVFFVTPHGHVPKAWNMQVPGSPLAAFSELALGPLAAEDMSEVLRPLHAYRDRLLVTEGLSHTSVLADIAGVMKTGGDLNNHSIGVAGLLTGSRALQRSGQPCSGGTRSLDQELALRTVAPGRYGSRVYGYDYVPNATVAPFSFLGPGQATPIVADPKTAFADLMGYYVSTNPGDAPSREQLFAAMRPSVLDAVAAEYQAVAPRLPKADQQKLADHRDLVRQLEASLGRGPSALCDPRWNSTGHNITQFMRLVKLALACDLTRVVTFQAPVPETSELGYPADTTFHAYAHASIAGATSCGQIYTPIAERAITDLGIWYAKHFATLLAELDAVPEGNGTVLDHTAVVWVSELATPTHLHNDTFALIAGGCNGFFRTGRYVRYARKGVSPIKDFTPVGPAHNRLHVSLLQAMGQGDTSFGMTEAMGADGSKLDLSGPLSELHR